MTLSDNAASGVGSGGAIYATDGAVIGLTNCTVSGNSAGFGGGGIEARGESYVGLMNTTVSGNIAFQFGGGILNFGAGGYTTLTNSIVAGNQSLAGDDLVGGFSGYYSKLTFTGGNLVGSAPEGFASVSGAPTVQINGASQSDRRRSSLRSAPIPLPGWCPAPSPTMADRPRPSRWRIWQSIPLSMPATICWPACPARTPAASPAAIFPAWPTMAPASRISAHSKSDQIVVTTLDDTVDPNDGQTSLREALTLANSSAGNVTITFDPSLSGGILTLDPGLGLLKITANDITIDGDTNGDGTPDITISGGNNTAVLFTATNGNIHTTLDGLVIENGYASPTTGFGGGIFVGDHDSLTLTNSIIADNSAADGGGIFVSNQASLAMADFTVSDNAAVKAGGGIVGYSGATLALTNVTISGKAPQKAAELSERLTIRSPWPIARLPGIRRRWRAEEDSTLPVPARSRRSQIRSSRAILPQARVTISTDTVAQSWSSPAAISSAPPRSISALSTRPAAAIRRSTAPARAICDRYSRRSATIPPPACCQACPPPTAPASRRRARPDRHCDRCRRHRRLAARHRDG